MQSINPRIIPLPDGRLQIRAPAKINLGLRVFPARADGFHNLETWMVPLSWHDTLWITPGGPLQLLIRGRSAGIPTEIDKNLIGKAALKLAAAYNVPPTAKIELDKVLPPGGGLGGGSSDAAAALLALHHAWQLTSSESQLAALAAELGSDVPFFLFARPALCTGRGEIMTPLLPAHPLFAVLIIPPQGCPTKDVFQAFDAGYRHPATPPSSEDPTDWPALAASPADTLDHQLINDLEPAAFHVAPWLADLRDQAARASRRKIHLTGSGSTLFALCSSGAAAQAIQSALAAALPSECACIPAQILTHPPAF